MFNRDEEIDSYDDVTLDDCPICREMRDEWGVVEEKPFDYLAARGVELADPKTLDDLHLSAALWRVINALAEARIYVDLTNHLSDRELYEALWSNALRQRLVFTPDDPEGAIFLPMMKYGDPCGDEAWMRYYADDASIRHFKQRYPDAELPPREPAPFKRDALLPKPWDAHLRGN